MNNRTREKALKIAVAGELLWNPIWRERFGNRQTTILANQLLKRAKFPNNVKVPPGFVEAYAIAEKELK